MLFLHHQKVFGQRKNVSVVASVRKFVRYRMFMWTENRNGERNAQCVYLAITIVRGMLSLTGIRQKRKVSIYVKSVINDAGLVV